MKKFLIVALMFTLLFGVGCRRCHPRYPKHRCENGKCEVITCNCGCMDGKDCKCKPCPLD